MPPKEIADQAELLAHGGVHGTVPVD